MIRSVFNSLSWGTPLYLLAIYGVVHYFSKPKTELKKGKVNWSPFEAVTVTLAIYFIAQLLGSIIVYLYPLAKGWDGQRITDWFNNSVNSQFFLVIAVEVLTMWFLYGFLKRRGASLRTIGLRKSKTRDIGYALLGFGLYFLLYIVVINIVQAVFPDLNINQEQQIGFNDARNFQLVQVFISLVILPPLVEELVVRGFLYTGLKNGLKRSWAVVLTSGLFAIAHLQAGSGAPLLWVAAIDTFVLSLVLIYLREKTGGLWASIGLHMLKNGLAFLTIFVFRVA